MEYKPGKNKELSALETDSGAIYHAKGSYSIDDKINGKEIVPVNRSYTILDNGDRVHKETKVQVS